MQREIRAFTLVELLVVVSIISVLMSVLLPALSAAREAGRTAVCLSNARQLMIASTTFAHDHRQHLPSAQDQSRNGVDRFWYGGGKFSQGIFLPEEGVMHGYLGNVDVAGCPSLKDDTRSFQGPVDYAYNVIYLGRILRPAPQRNELGEKLDRVRRPSRTVSFFDSGRINFDGEFERTPFGYPPSGRYGPEGSSIPIYIPSFHGRHNSGQGVVTWVDGHTSLRKPTVYDFYTLGLTSERLREHDLGTIDVNSVRDASLSPPVGGADATEE